MGSEVRGVPEASALTEGERGRALDDSADPREPQSDWEASIGRYLGRQRTLRGISLEELASSTKIPRRSLERLEAGAFDDDTDGFARGFVRTVAEALGLDPDEAVMRLLREPPDDEGDAAPLWLRAAQGAVALSAVVAAVVAIGWLFGPSEAPVPIADVEPAISSSEVVYRRDAVRELARAHQGPPSADVRSIPEPPREPASVAALPSER